MKGVAEFVVYSPDVTTFSLVSIILVPLLALTLWVLAKVTRGFVEKKEKPQVNSPIVRVCSFLASNKPSVLFLCKKSLFSGLVLICESASREGAPQRRNRQQLNQQNKWITVEWNRKWRICWYCGGARQPLLFVTTRSARPVRLGSCDLSPSLFEAYSCF